MRAYAPLLAALLAISPALAAEPDRPLTDPEVTAKDVAITPVTDLNLKKDEIPPLLTAARQKPYDLEGLRRCPKLAEAVQELDDLLGDDVDIVETEERGVSAGRLAQWLVGSFIPFRGAIREISGANERRRQWQLAIQAGIARRSFLKGVGEARGCKYPARSATAEVLAERAAARTAAEAAEASRRQKDKPEDKETNEFVSQPVVQPTN